MEISCKQSCAGDVSALYLHLPFCVRKCAYCDFTSRPTARGDGLLSTYAAALAAQLGELAEMGVLASCETAYLGGGTPTLLGPSALASLIASTRSAVPGIGELSCEANPDSLTDEVLEAIAGAGATRVSIGMQSLDDGELARLGRVHDAATARDWVRAAAATGLDVSVDLMCATPGQTDESWERTLREAVGLGVGHVSVYPLQIEEGTQLAWELGDEDPPWNDPDIQATRMERARMLLREAGFARYEVASYALPGKACRHNAAYWTGRPYVGLGEGASSMLTRETFGKLRDACPELPELSGEVGRVRLTVTSGACDIARNPVLSALTFDLELLTEAQAVAEDLMLAMRMTEGAGPELLGRAHALLGEERMGGALDDVVSRGLASWRGGHLAPTERGWLLGNELYGAFWQLAPGRVRTCSTA